jgi:hypothetical protein
VYSLVLERLQYLQGTTLTAGDRKGSSRLLATQKALFPVYTSLAAAVSRPRPTPGATGPAAARQRRVLFELAEKAEREARPVETHETVSIDALKEMRDAEKAPSRRPARLEEALAQESQAAPRTRRYLFIAAAILLVISIAVNTVIMMQRKAPPPSKGLAHFAPALPLDKTVEVGPILFAEVPDNYWDLLDAEDRKEGLALLGERAAGSGFGAVILADDNGAELGFWNPGQGAMPATPAGFDAPATPAP